MQKACTFNCSVIKNDEDGYDIGIHYQDSDGVDLALENQGDNLLDIVEDMTTVFIQEYYNSCAEAEEEEELLFDEEEDLTDEKYIEQLEKIIEDLTIENDELKTDLNILQKRADKRASVSKSIEEHRLPFFDGRF